MSTTKHTSFIPMSPELLPRQKLNEVVTVPKLPKGLAPKVEWVEPLLSHELFTHFEPMAVELMMSIPDKSVGGQLDLLGYDTKTKQVRLIDLKTKGNSKYDIKKRKKDGLIHLEDIDMYWKEPYLTDKQLGCYVEMLRLNYNLVPDVCNTIWAYEGRCILNNEQPTERCEAAWQKAWIKFEAKQELF